MIELLENLGGGLALSLIVVLAAGAVVMTALFGVAAVVVLARFAALAERPLPIAGSLLVWSGVVTVVALDLATAGLLQDSVGVRSAALRTVLGTLAAVALFSGGVRVALRRVKEDTLGWVALACAVLGLSVAAGHGLDYRSVKNVVAISAIEEVNIGFSIVARALSVGLEPAVREMVRLLTPRAADALQTA